MNRHATAPSRGPAPARRIRRACALAPLLLGAAGPTLAQSPGQGPDGPGLWPTIWSWATHNRWILAGAALLLVMLAVIWNRLSPSRRVYAFYVLLPLALLAWAGISGSIAFLYFLVFVLGMTTAFAEIIQKFRDEPLEALSTWQALLYHALNGVIAMFALQVLIAAGFQIGSTFEKIQVVLTAGLGSMLVMRSKLFSVKVGQETVAVGPEQLITIFLGYLEHEIDRQRSVARIRAVRELMGNLKFSAVRPYAVTMLHSAQVLGDKKRAEITKRIDEIAQDDQLDEQLRSFRLGFLLLTEMGDEFLRQLFGDPPAHFLRAAPGAGEAVQERGGFLGFLPGGPVTMRLFSAGDVEAREKLARQLGWPLLDLENLAEETGPVRIEGCEAVPAGKRGLPTLIERKGSKVEGVLYRLPEEALRFLAARHPESERRRVEALVGSDGKKREVVAFFLRTPPTGSDEGNAAG